MIARLGHARGEPYGRVEQRELAGLRCIGAQSSAIATFLTLRVREDGRTHMVTDGTPTLASYAGMADATLRRALRFLVNKGVVEEQPARPRAGAGQGSWVRPRRAVPFNEWPQDTLTTIRSCAAPTHRHPLAADGSRMPDTRSSVGRDPLTDAPRPAHPSVHTPASSIVLSSDRFATRDATNAIEAIGRPTMAENGSVSTTTGLEFASMDDWTAAIRAAREAA